MHVIDEDRDQGSEVFYEQNYHHIVCVKPATVAVFLSQIGGQQNKFLPKGRCLE